MDEHDFNICFPESISFRFRCLLLSFLSPVGRLLFGSLDSISEGVDAGEHPVPTHVAFLAGFLEELQRTRDIAPYDLPVEQNLPDFVWVGGAVYEAAQVDFCGYDIGLMPFIPDSYSSTSFLEASTSPPSCADMSHYIPCTPEAIAAEPPSRAKPSNLIAAT